MDFFEIKKGKKEGMKRRISQTHRLMELGRTLKVIDPKGHIRRRGSWGWREEAINQSSVAGKG